MIVSNGRITLSLMKHAITTFLVLPVFLASLLGGLRTVQGATVIQDAVAWWAFESDTTGTNGLNLTGVSASTTGLTPAVALPFESVSGIAAANVGTQAVKFDGTDVLKSNSATLRLGGAQTFWLRVNFGSISSGNMALMSRSRPINGSRGIALQLNNGRLAGYASSDGTTYEAQLFNSGSYLLQAGTWYDIALRYDPSNLLRIDLYDPLTGSLLDSQELTTNIPASISTSNSIGSGYFQVGGINNGSSGSSYVVPDGTLIESAGVWNRYLTNSELMGLSSVPEPRALSLLLLGGTSLAFLFRKSVH